MADNVAITAGSGTTVSTEEVTTLNGGAVAAQHVQRVATAFRTADVTAVDAATGAGAVNTGTQRTTLGSDDPAVVALQAMQSATGPVLIPSAGTPVSGTTASMTGTTNTQVLAAPGASLRNYVTTIIVSNSDATVGTLVQIRDGDPGTLLMTIPAAAAYGGAVISLPVPLKQPTTNTALFAQNVTTSAEVIVTCVGYTGA